MSFWLGARRLRLGVDVGLVPVEVDESSGVSAKWAYVLSSETAVKAASDWRSLLAASTVYR